MGTYYKYSMACSLVFFKVTPVLVNIRFIYHMHEARDLRETRIYTINTVLEKNNYLTTNTAYISQYSDTCTR